MCPGKQSRAARYFPTAPAKIACFLQIRALIVEFHPGQQILVVLVFVAQQFRQFCFTASASAAWPSARNARCKMYSVL